jgi:hypothetical protein
MKTWEVSNLWDLMRLPSGSGCQILSRSGKPVFQVGLEISGLQTSQSLAEIAGVQKGFNSLVNVLPVATRLRSVQVIDSNLRELIEEKKSRLAKLSEEDKQARFYIEEDIINLEMLVENGILARRRTYLFFTLDPGSLYATNESFVQKIAEKAVDFFYTAIGGASRYEQCTKEELEKNLKLADELLGSSCKILRMAGQSVRPLTEQDLWGISYERTHPQTVRRFGIPAYPTDWRNSSHNLAESRGSTPREVLYESEPIFEKDHVLIDGVYYGVVTLRQLPRSGVFGFLINELLGMPFEYEVVTDITIADQERERRNLGLIENTTMANVKSTEVPDQEQLAKLDQIQGTKREMYSEKARITEVGLAVVIRSNSLKELEENCNMAESIIRSMNEAVAMRERSLCWQAFTQTGIDSVNPIGKKFTCRSSRAVLLLPINSPKKGDKEGLVSFVCPTGDYYGFDPFDAKNPNFNIGVFAQSGHGKSVFIINMVTGAQQLDALVTILDVGVLEGGGSYKPLCTFSGGSYVQFASGTNAVNPMEVPTSLIFDEFDEGDFGDPNDDFAPPTPAALFARYKSYVSAVLFTMVNGDFISADQQLELAKIDGALTAFYSDPSIRKRINAAHRAGMGTSAWNDYPVLADYIKFVKNEDPIGSKVVQVLENRFCMGLEGAIFNRPSNCDMDSPFLVFDLKEVKPQILGAVVMVTNGAAIRRSYKMDGKKKLVVLDEAGVLIKSAVIAQKIAEFFATGRKSGISTILACQDYEQLMQSPYFPDIKANMGNVLFGAIYPATVETVINVMKVPEDIAMQLTGPGFKRNRLGKYSPWLHVRAGREYEIVQCRPPITTLWIAANDITENALKKKYLQAVGSDDRETAFRLLAADYPQLAEGGKQNNFLEEFISKKQEASRELAKI